MFSRRAYILIIVAFAISLHTRLSAQTFTEVGVSAGVDDTGRGTGLAWGDYDGDGDLDIYLSNQVVGINRLYRNNGNNTFTDIGSSAGVADSNDGNGVAWADYDNDGDLDLYLANHGQANKLFRNEGNSTFSEIGVSAGVNDIELSVGISWGDFNNDGNIDLYVVNGNSGVNKLFRNEANGTFSSIGATAGVNNGSHGFAAAWGDYDNDNDLDLYLANVFTAANILYRNEGNETFSDVSSSAGVSNTGDGRSTTWADYDNDGDLDLYIGINASSNIFYRNEGNSSFSDATTAAGIGNTGSVNGITWGDYDNDGDIDIYLNNSGTANVLYQNNGSGTFTDVAATAGVDDTSGGYATQWGDYDADGDLDLYLGRIDIANLLYRNNGNTNKWLHVKTVGTQSNKSGIGTQITAVTGTLRQRRDVDGGSGQRSQPSLQVEFGFGSTNLVDSLIVQWPSGTQQILANQSTNQVITLLEPGGAITFSEVSTNAGLTSITHAAGSAWGDFDNDGDSDLYVSRSVVGNNLYRNNGNSTFTDVANSAGVDHTGSGAASAIAWGDYDNDGDLDLYVTNHETTDNRLYRNNSNSTFTDVTVASGTNKGNLSIVTTNITWGDYDNDGFLDLFVGGSASFLYHNNGNSTFTNLAATSGASASTYSATWGDFDNDNDLDLYLNRSTGVGGTNVLYRNEGNGSFTNIASTAGVNDGSDGRGASWHDYDNDGDLDLYVASFNAANSLYQNNGNGTFVNVANTAGVEALGTGTSHTAEWTDYDNDGDVDLFSSKASGADLLYSNNNDGTFTDVATTVGVDDTDSSFGPAWADYDNDGDMDLFLPRTGTNPALLYRNNGNGNRWLHIKAVGTISNKAGIGTQVTTVANGVRQRRDVDGGSGLYSQPSFPVEFGFGGTTNVDSLILKWPSGIEQTFTNQSTNQLLTIVEAATVTLLIPDTASAYADTTLVPIRITSDVTGLGIVAAEICIAYDNTVVTPGAPDNTELTGSLVATGWSVEDNIFPGTGNIDTLSIAMSTAQDTLSGLGDLVYLVFKTTASRQPDSTAIEITKILFNDGDPSVSKQDGSLKLIGSDGAIVATPDSINPGDTITITVTDTDFDLDVGSPDQVSATAISKLYNDSQSVTLTETGNNTGVFTNTVNTIFSLSAGPSNDGAITTIAGDSICVSYVDSLTSAGTTLTRQDTVEVIGGSDGVVQASYVVQALDGRNGVRDTVRVQITDADLDTDVGIAEQVSATITNAISGEIETVTLTETAVSSGIFQVRVPSIAGASGTNNNGELSLAPWDTLNISYTDALTAQGGSSALLDTTRVVNLFGDVRINDQVQAFDAARLLAISVGLISSNTQTTLVGDVDGGGTIQAFDASLVLQYVVRLINRFPVQLDFTDDPKNHPFEKPVPLDQIIALGELQPQSDDTYLLPIHLGEREGILSGTLTLGLDPGIEVLDITPATGYSSFMTAHNASAQDVLRIAFAGSQSDLSGSGDVITLHLRSTGDAPIRLSLDQVTLNGQLLTPSVNIEAIETVEAQMQTLVTDLYHNVPNPFNPQTTIRYDLSQAGQVNLVIYSITGQRIRTLVSEHQTVGSYQIVWDGKDALGRNVGSGVYLMHMNTNSFTKTQKMLLLR